MSDPLPIRATIVRAHVLPVAMPPARPVRRASLLLVDDHPLFADGFAAMVRQARPDWTITVCHDSASGVAALASRRDWDMAIVDLQLPDRDGFATIAAMAAVNASVPRLIISGREDEAAKWQAHRAGASGFLLKSLPTEQMLMLIDRVLDGDSGFADTLSPGDMPTLSQRQTDVLLLLAEGIGNKEIRYRLGIAERTVRAHLTDVFQALGVQSRVQAILRARELGLIA